MRLGALKLTLQSMLCATFVLTLHLDQNCQAQVEKNSVEFSSDPIGDGTVIIQSWTRIIDVEIVDIQDADKVLGKKRIEEGGKKRVTLQCLGGSKPTFLRVRYERFDEGPPDLRKAKDIVDMTYILDARDRKNLLVLNSKGEKAPLLEKVLICACNEDFLDEPPLANKLTSQPPQVGNEIMVNEEDLKILFSSMSDISTAGQGTLRLIYRGQKNGSAVFDTHQVDSKVVEGLESGFDLTGELHVDPSGCRVTSYKAKGKVFHVLLRKDQQGNVRKFRTLGNIHLEMSTQFILPTNDKEK